MHGSRQPVRTLHDAGLVDEYRMPVLPVVLGTGKRLFGDGAAVAAFTLADSGVTPAGVSYQVLRPATSGSGASTIEDGREVIRTSWPAEAGPYPGGMPRPTPDRR